ncbi:unnamed protein product [Rhizophagus irregularis]|nr:unnamed protein product [Rhizophagus irregularis]
MAKKVDSGVCATIHKIQLIWPNWAKQLLKRHKNDDNEDPLLLIEWKCQGHAIPVCSMKDIFMTVISIHWHYN